MKGQLASDFTWPFSFLPQSFRDALLVLLSSEGILSPVKVATWTDSITTLTSSHQPHLSCVISTHTPHCILLLTALPSKGSLLAHHQLLPPPDSSVSSMMILFLHSLSTCWRYPRAQAQAPSSHSAILTLLSPALASPSLT